MGFYERFDLNRCFIINIEKRFSSSIAAKKYAKDCRNYCHFLEYFIVKIIPYTSNSLLKRKNTPNL